MEECKDSSNKCMNKMACVIDKNTWQEIVKLFYKNVKFDVCENKRKQSLKQPL